MKQTLIILNMNQRSAIQFSQNLLRHFVNILSVPLKIQTLFLWSSFFLWVYMLIYHFSQFGVKSSWHAEVTMAMRVMNSLKSISRSPFWSRSAKSSSRVSFSWIFCSNGKLNESETFAGNLIYLIRLQVCSKASEIMRLINITHQKTKLLDRMMTGLLFVNSPVHSSYLRLSLSA